VSITWPANAGPWRIGRPSAAGPGLQFVPPTSGTSMQGPFVWDDSSAREIPSVSRCLQLYSGLVRQMPMDAYRGDVKLPRPRLLDRPDPINAGSWFVGIQVEDYLMSGNAVSLVTSRDATGWPATVAYLPIVYVYIVWIPGQPVPDYYFYGMILDPADVIHVKRGADRWYGAVRGLGVVEEGLGTLDRVAAEEVYESSTLASSSVPSVAIITPQATLTQDVADAAKTAWEAKYGGPNRLPAILPAGTQVLPLAWSPSDTQLIEARHMSLIDVANLFNIDGYWLGAPVSGMTYRTAGPQYQQVVKTSLAPVLADFEDVWSNSWLPRGQTVRFDRNRILQEDLATTMTAVVAGYAAGLMTVDEARAALNLPPTDDTLGPPPSPQPFAPPEEVKA
jgi:HK97 family phage portal protein